MSVSPGARLWDLDPQLAFSSLLDSAEGLVNQLNDVRSRDIIAARLGLDGDPPTLAVLGSVYGVSRERIRQLQSKALERCVRQARHLPSEGLIDQVAAVTEHISADGSVAFVRLAVTFSSIGATPVFIELLRRLLKQPKDRLALVREGLLELRVAERQRLTDAEKDAWVAKHVIEPAWWPSWIGSLSPCDFAKVREVDQGGLGQAGTFTSSKLDREVQYESMLEFRLLRALEAAPIVSHYQEQPVAIPYEREGSKRRYVPDVLVWLSDGRALLVEVKPVLRMLDDKNQMKLWAAHRWCAENGVGLLFTDGHIGSLQLRARPVPPQAQQALSVRLGRGPISWPEYTGYIEQFGLRCVDLTAMGLRNGWRVERRPWQLIS